MMKKPLQPTSRPCAEPFGSFCEPTIAEILADPIIKAVMQADNVDRKALQKRLRSVALSLSNTRRLAGGHEASDASGMEA